MINPSLEELVKSQKANRYELTVATAKGARMVTDEYFEKRAEAEKIIATTDSTKTIAGLIDKEYRDQKSVRCAINRIVNGTYKIVLNNEE